MRKEERDSKKKPGVPRFSRAGGAAGAGNAVKGEK